MNIDTQELSANTHADYLDTRVDQAVQSFWESAELLLNAEELEYNLSCSHGKLLDVRQLN